MDPLTLLRDFNQKKQVHTITVQNDKVSFADKYHFPINAVTAFKSQNGSGELYSLQCILFYLKNRTLSAGDYLKTSLREKVPPVNLVDRKKLLAYLDGDLDESHLPLADASELISYQNLEGSNLEPPTKKSRHHKGEEQGSLKTLMQQERQLRNRNTMLVAPNRTFDKVLDILKAAMSADVSRQHHAAHHPEPQRRPEPAHVPRTALPIKPSGRFERDSARDQLKAMAGESAANLGDVLSLYGFKGQNKGASQQPSTDKAPPSQPSRPSTSHGPTALPPPPSRHGAPHSSKDGRPSGGSSSTSSPIIIVPSGMTALINMWNAKQFLQDGQFVLSDQVRQADASAAKPVSLVFKRTAGRPKPVSYTVTDKAPPKGSPDWQRVVGVIAQGANWQFKDWPFRGADKGDLVDTFNKVCGFYVHFRDEKVPDLVGNWNVKRLPLHRTNRHLDMAAMLDLYSYLDQYLTAKKCSLTY